MKNILVGPKMWCLLMQQGPKQAQNANMYGGTKKKVDS
jgi:hypothetical protein